MIDDGTERRGARGGARALGQRRERARRAICCSSTRSIARAGVAPELMPDLIATLRRLVEGEILQLRGRVELDVSRGHLRAHPARQDGVALRLGDAHRRARRRRRPRSELALRALRRGARRRVPARGRRARLQRRARRKDAVRRSYATASSRCRSCSRSRRTPSCARRSPDFRGRSRAGLAVSRAVVESGACDEVRRRAHEHTKRAVAALDAVTKSPARSLLTGVAEALSARAV